jgi:hypothetical protein
VDWAQGLELTKAIFGLIAHLAWPIVAILIVVLVILRFGKEISGLIERGFQFEGFGIKVNAVKEAREALKFISATTSEDAKKDIAPKRLIDQAADEIATEDGTILMQLALTDPRQAVLRSFYLLARAIIRKAFDPAPIPDDSVMDVAIERLKAKGILNDRHLIQIGALRKMGNVARIGYVPSPDEAAQFVFYSTSIREDLGDKVD